ncbi:MAG: FAD-dependent oxidoreductase [Robiginitomaculum sp.]|nr:MAG: FAD-dependent oxidoreductase [Robiginitomaculum sp.]
MKDWHTDETEWDMIVIGGGITGAGLALEAARRGVKVLLVEQRDFAWGTSSRSSKMVHGGLRYLVQGKFGLTRESVRERQRLLDEAPGLVEPLKYLYLFRKGAFPNRYVFDFVLNIYGFFAKQRDHKYFGKAHVQNFLPGVKADDLLGATQYTDALTDDSRLVMRLLHEARHFGASALNYVKVTELNKQGGQVTGVRALDGRTGKPVEFHAKVVVNATGAWADRLRSQVRDEKRVRPLRGSHITVPSWRLPVHQAIGFNHPGDGRVMFICPWQGVTMIGTTDLDHEDDLDVEAAITNAETQYLLAGAIGQFPDAKITREDILTTWSGVRPIVSEEGVDPKTIKPSAARRDHIVWSDEGLITVTGGKLTTFRIIALDVLAKVGEKLGLRDFVDNDAPIFTKPTPKPIPKMKRFGPAMTRKLHGYYGANLEALINGAKEDELCYVAGTQTLWAELRWCAANEAVAHLDDLLLRRTRLGFLLPKGGAGEMQKIRTICKEELGWKTRRWNTEWKNYQEIWHSKYSLPEIDETTNKRG